MAFDFEARFKANLPPAAVPWGGFAAYNFTGGHNDPDGVPVAALTAAAQRVLEREGQTLATYNLQSGPQGYRPLRDVIVGALAANAGLTCTPEQLLVTSGSLQALDLVNSVLVSAGDTAIVEEGTYGGAMTRLRRLGADWVGVPVDDDGLRTDALANALAALRERGTRVPYLYTIPTVQNPTGTVMTRERRLELLRVAAEYDVAVFEDDCYADLIWHGERPPALRGLDTDGRVVYCGSFSKSIAPALRVGYIVADWPLMSRLLAAKTDGGTGALEQMVLAEFAREHFDAHVRRQRETLRNKCDAMMAAVREHFGDAATFREPRGGIFLWITLPEAVDTTRLAEAALAEGVAINPGAEWAADAEAGRRALRLCFGNPSLDTIREGVARLAAICRRETGVPAPERVAPIPTPPAPA